VFFNLFAAAEPSASVCVAHGTLCNNPSVYTLFVISQMCGNAASMLYFYVSAEPLADTRGTSVEKHCCVLINNLVVMQLHTQKNVVGKVSFSGTRWSFVFGVRCL